MEQSGASINLSIKKFNTIFNPKSKPKIYLNFHSYISPFCTIFDSIFIIIFACVLAYFLTKNSSFILIRSQNFDSIFILIFPAFSITPSDQKLTPIGIQSIFKKTQFEVLKYLQWLKTFYIFQHQISIAPFFNHLSYPKMTPHRRIY